MTLRPPPPGATVYSSLDKRSHEHFITGAHQWTRSHSIAESAQERKVVVAIVKTFEEKPCSCTGKSVKKIHRARSELCWSEGKMVFRTHWKMVFRTSSGSFRDPRELPPRFYSS